MREVCFLIGRGGAILYADAGDGPAALPDSRTRWQAIWDHRDELEDVVHSHPMGPATFSAEDESTMEAIDSALGRHLRYTVVAPTKVISRVGDDSHDVVPEPWWAGLIRLASGMKKEE